MGNGRQQHEEITAYLRSAISSQEFAPGDPLPSESELCQRFETSRGPVRQAMAALRAEGLISSGRGRRTIVLDTVPTQSFDGVISYSEWCRQSGFEPGQLTQSVTRRPADPALAAALEIEPRTPVVSVFRLRLLNGRPAMVERLNYPLEVGRHLLTFDTDSGSIYQHLIDSGVDINNATRTIDAIGADADDAQLLGVAEGAPLLRVRRRAFTSNGTPVESSDDRYLPGTASFTLNTIRGNPSPLSMVSAR
ncbi:GntR family transcriptional regulator [Citricoccus sp. SGAir0253]|uniref:GntR family transcriptional regulator n=1 Tax=Citricoccus sp. SGAir0253 TaxID=2567881 RepID=UPI0010CCB66C|nr:GntR family transcriptional regulator [Citricoccus sp. SGAir0253]QCU78220.1 GntR family transcriptional regulator [Citricoccus sp. SGAir0253]